MPITPGEETEERNAHNIYIKKKKKLAPTADHKPPLEFIYTDFVTKDVQEDIIKASTDTHSQNLLPAAICYVTWKDS